MIKILIIEDDPIDRMALEREFSDLNWHYVLADSLVAAQALLEDQHFDLIVSDYILGDGVALGLIRSHQVPVIIVTGMGDEEIAVQALKAGATDYLIKDTEGQYLKYLPRAIGNALLRGKLERQEHEQRMFAQALFDSAGFLTNTLDLDEVLGNILWAVQGVIPCDTGAVLLIEEDVCAINSSFGWEGTPDLDILHNLRFSVKEIPELRHIRETKEALLIPDLANSRYARFSENMKLPIRSSLTVAIHLADDVIGLLSVGAFAPDRFTNDHCQRLQAFAHHAAIAIQNAKLYEASRRLAALEERQRLARDLHDSVTQTLFTANLTAQTLKRLWEKDPQLVTHEIDDLVRLNQGALAEMRTLLLELRPSALQETDLAKLIEQLAETLRGRSHMEVELYTSGRCPLPAHVHLAFFRIAQEALNNVAKHADAKQVSIELLRRLDQVSLRIMDDGIGFDLEAVSGGTLGYRSCGSVHGRLG
ncbi:MAG: response regulator [Anaerolineae bacterium]|nr:response regulator [Anaerolineae bacterium]